MGSKTSSKGEGKLDKGGYDTKGKLPARKKKGGRGGTALPTTDSWKRTEQFVLIRPIRKWRWEWLSEWMVFHFYLSHRGEEGSGAEKKEASQTRLKGESPGQRRPEEPLSKEHQPWQNGAEERSEQKRDIKELDQ